MLKRFEMKKLKKFLCRLGIHKWLTEYTRGRMYLHKSSRRCKWCLKKQYHDTFYGWETEEKSNFREEQMKKISDFINKKP